MLPYLKIYCLKKYRKESEVMAKNQYHKEGYQHQMEKSRFYMFTDRCPVEKKCSNNLSHVLHKEIKKLNN